MRNRGLRIAVIVAAVLLAVAFASVRLRANAKPKAKVGRTAVAREGAITVKVSENGTLEPVTQVDVKSRVAGRVQRIYVKEGQTVRPGETLAVVDPTEVERQVAGIRAQLASAQAGEQQAEENYRLTVTQNRLSIRRAEVALANAEAQLREQKVALRQAQAGLAQAAAPTRRPELDQQQASLARAEAQVADAQRTLDRRRALVAKGFLSQQEADAAQTQLQLAQADVEAQKQRLALLKEGPRREDVNVSRVAVDAARERVRTSEIAVETARVALETERANAATAQLRLRDVERGRAEVAQISNQLAQQSVSLNETRIVAPIGGEVIGKYLEEGELVASATAGFAQGAALVSIADLSRMQVRVNINEVDVARITLGMPVEIKVDGVPNRIFKGRVAAIAPASTGQNQKGQSGSSSSSAGGSQTGVVRFEVKVAVENADRRLRPGMTANVDIILDRKEKTVLLPAEAVRPDGKVTVVTGDGDAVKKEDRPVQVGLKNDAEAQITSGLKPGEKVEIPKIDAKDRRKINFNGPE
jgi:HlyD family secretion protein